MSMDEPFTPEQQDAWERYLDRTLWTAEDVIREGRSISGGLDPFSSPYS